MMYEVNSAGRADPVPGTESDDDEVPEPVSAADILARLVIPSTGLAAPHTLGRDR